MQRKIWIVIIAILVFLAVMGWGAYRHYFTPDPEISQALDEQFGNSFFISFEGQVPKGGESVKPDGKSLTDAVVKDIEVRSTIQNISSQVAEVPDQTEFSEEAIVQKYVPQFQALEETANYRLEVLFAAARQEYRQQKGLGTLDIPGLTRKYIQAGTKLEAGVDNQFYSLLDSLEKELIANKQSAVVIGEIKRDYIQAKSAKQRELLAKARR